MTPRELAQSRLTATMCNPHRCHTSFASSGTTLPYQNTGTMMLYQLKEFMVAITASEARKRLFPLIKQVNDDRAPVEIISNHGRAYLVAADDYESMEETDYLLRSPANATRLMAAADEVRRGRSLLTKTMEELETMADEDEPL
jgi:antitoxin YefM